MIKLRSPARISPAALNYEVSPEPVGIEQTLDTADTDITLQGLTGNNLETRDQHALTQVITSHVSYSYSTMYMALLNATSL